MMNVSRYKQMQSNPIISFWSQSFKAVDFSQLVCFGRFVYSNTKKLLILHMTFSNALSSISIKISLTFVSKGPINSVPLLVQKMAWHRPGDKPLSEPILVSLCVTRPQWVNTVGTDVVALWVSRSSTTTVLYIKNKRVFSTISTRNDFTTCAISVATKRQKMQIPCFLKKKPSN